MGKQKQMRNAQPKAEGDQEQKLTNTVIPIWVAIIGGIFTLLGIALTAYLNSTQQAPYPTLILQPTEILTPKPGTCPDDMVLIPSGKFWLGVVQGDNDAQKEENTGKSVYLDVFCIDRMDVSNEQYGTFVSEAKHRPPPSAVAEPDSWIGTSPSPGYATYPVVRVSWFDADSYCEWKGRALPTEAQWEKAARGNTNWIYPWGNTWDSTRANGGEKNASIQPVNSYPEGKSPYGVLNIAGNVAEWVTDLTAPPNSPTQVIKGGSFVEHFKLLRISARLRLPPNFPNLISLNNIGFRCAQRPFG